jgi:Domain of unknown function (DU1801)
VKNDVKTKVNDASVLKFLESIPDSTQRADSSAVVQIMRNATGMAPKMWGSSIIGFDSYHYLGKSGREGDWFLVGLSPRKQALTLYVLGGWEREAELLGKLGKHSLGKGCLYIKRLQGVKMPVLKKLIDLSVKRARKQARAEEAKQKSQMKR